MLEMEDTHTADTIFVLLLYLSKYYSQW